MPRYQACVLALIVGCGGIEPGEVMPGNYTLYRVHFVTERIQSVPATAVFGTDTTVVESGELTLDEEGRCFLQLVQRWRPERLPGGDTIRDTLSYVFETRGDFFGTVPVADWFRLFRGPDHIGNLARVGGETLVVVDYDRAGPAHFYFQR